MKYREKLETQYKEEILCYNWDRLQFISVPNEDGDDFYETCFVGTVFGLTPSGKYYTFWTTNQTARDVIRDQAWWAAFEAVLEEKGYWHECDGGDIFVARPVQEWVEFVDEDGILYEDPCDGRTQWPAKWEDLWRLGVPDEFCERRVQP